MQVLLLLLALVVAAETPEAPPLSYTRDVKPIVEKYCIGCHGPDDQQNGLRLDSFEGLMRGGDTGPPVVARNSRASLLIAKVERRARPPMPPRRRLPSAAVAVLRAWIDAGARE